MDILEQEQLETYKSLVSLSSLALKTLLLLNGGAAIALLAFLGNTWGRDDVPDVRASMALFLCGLACAGGATLVGYLAQLKLYQERRDNSFPSYLRGHVFKLHVAVSLASFSMLVFCVGSYFAVVAFESGAS